jgi:hypothetical protein
VTRGAWHSSHESRLRAARAVLASGLIAGVLLSIPLWLTHRAFPLLPRIAAVRPLAVPFDWLALGLFLALAALVAVRRAPRVETMALVVLGVGLVLQDQTRCQPWVYQYLLMLLAAVRLGRGPDDPLVRLDTLRLLTAGLYLWSGLQKFNLIFFVDYGPWFLEPIAEYLPLDETLRSRISYAFPFVELAVGAGLLVPRLRRFALFLGSAMHLYILYALGPLGHAVNSIVWPWNAAMIALLWILFAGTEGSVVRPWWTSPPVAVRLAVFAAFWVLPALNFARLWDTNLSWGMYAGMNIEAEAYIDEPAAQCLDADVRRLLQEGDDGYVLKMWLWAVEVTNVPVYPERWVFRRLHDRLCACDPEGKHIVFDLWEPRRWHLPTPVEEYTCGQDWH